MRVLLFATAALALTATAGSEAATNTAANAAAAAVIRSVSAPEGFEQLARPREIVVDLYFGGRKVGEARAVARPGFIRFDDPPGVAALLPDLVDAGEITQQFSKELPTNANLVCSPGRTTDCNRLAPAVAGLIFDEGRFRAELFVAPRLLRVKGADSQVYLATPTAPLSLTSSAALALSGTAKTSTNYNLQNRTIVGFRNARLRSDSSFSSGLGLFVDDVVAEVDSNNLRYSGGLFWAPGIDLVGRRRMVGVGVSTQFDTRADRESLNGTPIVLFLGQSARVDLVVDGRLVGSQGYDAGNNMIDTSSLPDGSYPLVLRIHELGARVREVRRFFVKNAQIAPVGKPIYFAYAGKLANARPHSLVSISKDYYYAVGTARRLSETTAVDVSVIGTGKKALAEVGAWLVTEPARIRAAGLVSSMGDRAALFQVQSSDVGGFAVSVDVRRVWSKDGKPLLPAQTFVGGFDTVPLTAVQLGGSFLQASGSVGYSFGQAYVSMVGSLRKDDGHSADYTIGPDVRWALVNSTAIRLMVQASAQKTDSTTASYIGFQLVSNFGRMSILSSGGHATRSTAGGGVRRSSRAIGSFSGQYSYDGDDRTQISAIAGVDRSLDSTLGHLEGNAYTRFGSAHGDIWRDFEGTGDTQFGLSLQTGIALGRDQFAFGGRDVAESAIVVSVDGAARSAFEVLVNDQPRGRVSVGSYLPLFLQPYRAYKVRMRPLSSGGVSFDSSAREVTLYPGNVQLLRWRAERNFTIFAQALTPNGTPVADAMVQSPQGVGQTDSNGYFQVDASNGDLLQFSGSASGNCKVRIDKVDAAKDFASLGKLVCR